MKVKKEIEHLAIEYTKLKELWVFVTH